jgi:hypothetical protein
MSKFEDKMGMNQIIEAPDHQKTQGRFILFQKYKEIEIYF